MVSALTKALERRSQAAEAVAAIVKDRYGVGAGISWKRHGIHSGYVVMVGYGDRVKVRNERTGKEFWIYAHDILES